MRSKNIQDPATRIQDQPILATTSIVRSYFEYTILCNWGVNAAKNNKAMMQPFSFLKINPDRFFQKAGLTGNDFGEEKKTMLEAGTPVEMTKGYKGVQGVIMERTDSEFEFYVIKLENGIQLVAGPTAFVSLEKGKGAPRQTR